MSKNKIIVTEQVSKYHPDKYADQISDYIVEKARIINPNAKCAIEVLVKDDTVVLAGELSGVDFSIPHYEKMVLDVADDLNYTVDKVINLISEQSIEINQAVIQEKDEGFIGAGDQGIMYGYATRESPDFIPFGHFIANKIIEALEKIAKLNKIIKGDAKVQVETEYISDLDIRINTIVCSAAHFPEFSLKEVKLFLERVIKSVVEKYYSHPLDEINYIINPSGTWTIAGPYADAGVTGRKIVADAYGGGFLVGGGAFSGKDFTKVDRSGAYIARVVALKLLQDNPDVNWVKVELSYSIALPTPLSIVIDSNIGDLSDRIDHKSFIVKNMVEYLTPLSAYKLSQGCHFRNLIIK